MSPIRECGACLHAPDHPPPLFFSKIEFGTDVFTGCHYHPEIELMLVRRSGGTRIIGDSIEPFGDDDVVLIGKNTPHAFLHEPAFFYDAGDSCTQPVAMGIHFHENFPGTGVDMMPEFKDIYSLFSLARQGLSLTEPGKRSIIPLVEAFFKRETPLDGVILLLEILKRISTQRAYKVLSERDFSGQDHFEDERYAKVLNYTYNCYDEHITIERVAKIANLTRESFCRYFKARSNKTYVEFLTEYRIGKACQMIRQGGGSIKEVGYACGFDSLSNFYYQFKKIKKQSPLEYARELGRVNS